MFACFLLDWFDFSKFCFGGTAWAKGRCTETGKGEELGYMTRNYQRLIEETVLNLKKKSKKKKKPPKKKNKKHKNGYQ